jgi:hypothetical protein
MDSKAKSVKSPTRKIKYVMSPKRMSLNNYFPVSKAASPKRKTLRGRSSKKEEHRRSESTSSSSSSSSNSSYMKAKVSKPVDHCKKYKVPKGAYPPGFDICGYAKELYDANKEHKSFEYADFHKAMAMYSMVFCYEKELRVLKGSKKNMAFAWSSYDGIESALSCIFENTKHLLWKSEAQEIGKNEDIQKVHVKNIMTLLKQDPINHGKD